jgi:hypothetical protein
VSTDHTPTEELVAKLRRGAATARKFGVNNISRPVPVVEETAARLVDLVRMSSELHQRAVKAEGKAKA